MSKVLIDIPEHNLNVIKRFVGGDGFEELPPRIIEDLIRSVYLGIVLDGLTNGEVIQKMFPQLRVIKWRDSVQVMGKNYEFNHTYPLDWWNRKWGE